MTAKVIARVEREFDQPGPQVFTAPASPGEQATPPTGGPEVESRTLTAGEPSDRRDGNHVAGAVQPLLLLIGLSNDLSSTWGDFLDRCGFRVPPDEDGGTVAATVRRNRPDVVVLDLSSTGDLGLQVITDIHHEASVPIIVTAEAAEVDPVSALSLGADDYMPQPVSLPELAARARAAVRRSQRDRPRVVPPATALDLNRDLREVCANGRRIRLTPLEFRLLDYLARAPERAFARDHLVEAVYGGAAGCLSATVDHHIQGLRKKLRAAGISRPSISTVRGFGFRLEY
jgi:DNA-binding response OmpR family regulator